MSYPNKKNKRTFRDDSSKKNRPNYKRRNSDQKDTLNINSKDMNTKSNNNSMNYLDGPRSEFRRNSNRDINRRRTQGSKDQSSSFKGSSNNSSNQYNSNSLSQRHSRSFRRDFSSARNNSNSLNNSVEEQVYLYEESTDLIWGRHSTQAAFETGRPIHRIWCTSEIRSSSKFFQFLRDAKTSGVLVEEVSWARLAQITKGAVHQGIALQTASAETIDLEKLVKACRVLNESALLLALDGITDPHNLGAIIRSAEALGAHGLVLPQRRSAGLTGSVAKVAAGALEHLPVARVINLNRSLLKLKKEGYKVIGLAEEGESPLQEVDLEGPLVVVIGSEGRGISLITRKHCDQLVRIPLRGITTSLNASIATSVVLYEIARNTWMKGISGQSPSPKLHRAKFPVEGDIDI